jgi:hypothetical protein
VSRLADHWEASFPAETAGREGQSSHRHASDNYYASLFRQEVRRSRFLH